jgi:hypothetical protein
VFPLFATTSLTSLPRPPRQIIGSLYGWAAGEAHTHLSYQPCSSARTPFDNLPNAGLESHPSNATAGSGVSMYCVPLRCSLPLQPLTSLPAPTQLLLMIGCFCVTLSGHERLRSCVWRKAKSAQVSG